MSQLQTQRETDATAPGWVDLGSETSRRIRSLNPMRQLSDRCDDSETFVMLSGLSVVALSLIVPGVIESVVIGAGIFLSIEAYFAAFGDDDEEVEVDHARELFVAGEIGLDEFESRLDVLLDEDRRQVRETVESIPLIGPERSSRIASRYSSRDLRAADVDELSEIPGIGESLAVEIVEEVGR